MVQLEAAGSYPLTYCANAHPARDLAEAEKVLREVVGPVLRGRLGAGVLCFGAWWPQDVVGELNAQATSEGDTSFPHRDLCLSLRLAPRSLNAFPMNRFHGEPVKERVYEPDWGSPARLSYTLDCAALQAEILRAFGIPSGVISTLPLGFRGRDRKARPKPEQRDNLVRLALGLAAIEQRTGVRIQVALEPEPWCLLESMGDTLSWLEGEAAPQAARVGAEAVLRRHLGICLDLCHAAVVGEDPILGLRLALERGWQVPKVQLSSALVAGNAAGLEALRAKAEPIYLHQTWLSTGRQGPFLDLDDPMLHAFALAEGEELRSHVHTPLHLEREGPLRSTQDQVLAFLGCVQAGEIPEGTVLEIETYTTPRMDAELAFVCEALGLGSENPPIS